MSDFRCSICATLMDQSDACSHVCPPDPLRERLDIVEREVAILRSQIRSLQLAAPRGLAALATTEAKP